MHDKKIAPEFGVAIKMEPVDTSDAEHVNTSKAEHVDTSKAEHVDTSNLPADEKAFWNEINSLSSSVHQADAGPCQKDFAKLNKALKNKELKPNKPRKNKKASKPGGKVKAGGKATKVSEWSRYRMHEIY